MFRFNLASINNLKRGIDLRAFNESAISDASKRLPQIVIDQMKEDQKILFELSYQFSFESSKDPIQFDCGEKMKPRVIFDHTTGYGARNAVNWSVQNEDKQVDNGLRLIKSLVLTELLFIVDPFRVNQEIVAETMLYSNALKDETTNKYWYFLTEIFAHQNADLYSSKNAIVRGLSV